MSEAITRRRFRSGLKTATIRFWEEDRRFSKLLEDVGERFSAREKSGGGVLEFSGVVAEAKFCPKGNRS